MASTRRRGGGSARTAAQFWAHVTITAITDEDGEHLGFAKVTRDHTERMEMLEQQGQYAHALAEANARLEEMNAELAASAEEQARFLAVTAHELRTPVGVLSMSARLLAESLGRGAERRRARGPAHRHAEQRGAARSGCSATC